MGSLSESDADALMEKLMGMFKDKTVLCITHQNPGRFFDRTVTLKRGKLQDDDVTRGDDRHPKSLQ